MVRNGVPQEEVGTGGRSAGSHAGRVAAAAGYWKSMLKVSTGFGEMLTDGLLDLPTEACWGLPPMGAIPQSEDDLEFGRKDLESGCKSGVYEEVSQEEAEDLVRRGYLISSAFTVWQGDRDSRKGRFVVNFSRQSKFWGKGSVRMERLEEFSDELVESERLISFDLVAGYRHVHLHPLMLNFFLFSYAGRVYRCLALPFGWGRSAFHFTRFLRPMVSYLRNALGYRILWYLDDFLIAPGSRRGTKYRSSRVDCSQAARKIDLVLLRLGLERHQSKGVWGDGATELDHLGFHISTLTMRISVPSTKQVRLRSMAGKLLRQSAQGKGFVAAEVLRTFCGVAVSLTLAVPLARFHTRSLYDVLTRSRYERGAGRDRVRLNRTARKDLKFWRNLGPEGRCMKERAPEACTHSDAADLGWGGTYSQNLAPGSGGVPIQGLWDVEEVNKTIAYRELRALRLVLDGFCRTVGGQGAPMGKKILCWVDNAAVVYIVRAMVTASEEIMPELRLLRLLLQREKLELDVRWISSALNRHADRLSRTWDPSEPQLSRAVTAFLKRSLSDWVGRGQVFRYRLSGGEHPVAQRKSAEAALLENWGDGRARFFNPPPQLLGITLSKMAREGARGVVVVPLWIETQSVARLRRMADRVVELHPSPGSPLVVGARTGTAQCPLLLAEVGLYCGVVSASGTVPHHFTPGPTFRSLGRKEVG